MLSLALWAWHRQARHFIAQHAVHPPEVGRRIEDPLGGTTAAPPPRKTSAQRCEATEAHRSKVGVLWLGKISTNFGKISARSRQDFGFSKTPTMSQLSQAWQALLEKIRRSSIAMSSKQTASASSHAVRSSGYHATLSRYGQRSATASSCVRQVLDTHAQKHAKISKKLSPEPPKSRPGGFKIELGALQDAILEAQEAPKSRPRREKINVKNQYAFGIDF